jgi:hypothetical protein
MVLLYSSIISGWPVGAIHKNWQSTDLFLIGLKESS